MTEHRKAHLSGMPGSCACCGSPWPCPTEAAHRRRLRASSAHMARQPIIEGSYLPPSVLLGGGWPEPAIMDLGPDNLTDAEVEELKQRFLAEANRPDRWQRIRVLQPCPACGQLVPIHVGADPRICAGHSWWERAKHWADEHPVKLWLAFWTVLVPVTAVIVVIFP